MSDKGLVVSSGLSTWQKILIGAAVLVLAWFAWTQVVEVIHSRDARVATAAVEAYVAKNETNAPAPVGNSTSPILVIPASKEACGYDFEFMPEGRDEFNVPKADYGIKVDGVISGPAIVQIDSMAIVAVYPEESFEVPKGATVWMYTGGESCVRAQFGDFPGKTVYTVDMVSTN